MREIFIGAGHSNADPGATAFGQTEAGIVTELRDLLAAKLRADGCDVLTDGVGGVNLPLKNSIAIAKTAGGPRVEFHLNAGPPTAKGIEVLSLPSLKSNAQAIAMAIASALGITLRGEGGWKSDSSGQHHRLGFCREGGGMVVETFFLSNKAELDTYTAKKTELVDALATVLKTLAE